MGAHITPSRFYACLVTLAIFTASPAHAYECLGNDTTAEGCQASIPTGGTAPLPSVSAGVRINRGVTNAIFNSYATSCWYVDNNSSEDYFIPQETESEFRAFALNPPHNVNVANCVPPVSSPASPFKATASIAHPKFQIFAENGSLTPLGEESVSSIGNIAVPTDQSYGRVPSPSFPGTVVNITQVLQHAGPLEFIYTREDCRINTDGQPLCNTRNLKEQQTLTFAAQSTAPNQDGIWTLTRVTSAFSIQSLQTGAWISISGPAADFQPPAALACSADGLHADGQSWTSGVLTNVAPTADQCPYGPGTRVDTVSTPTTYICNDGVASIQNTGAPQLVSSAGECEASPFGGTADTTGAHAYLYALTPLSVRGGLQGYGGNVNLLKASNRIPDVEFYASQINVPSQNFSLGFPGYPDLTTWFGICYDGGYNAPTSGNYTFVTAADDGVALWVDGNFVSDYEDNEVYTQIVTNTGAAPNNMVPRSSPSVYLTAGTHHIMIKYYQGWATALGIQMWVKPPNSSKKTLLTLENPPNGQISCPH
ncbi:MAG: PA14 domain-containing protein [Bdellovibrionales bacterium]